MSNYKRCTVTIMDTTDPLITFDSNGVSSHVKYFEDSVIPAWGIYQKDNDLKKVINQIKNRKIANSNYDCIAGISGGVDSSYLVYRLKDWGLKTLIVHIDAGWNSKLAVENIYKVVEYSGFDLETLVVDWEEFRKVQIAFLKSGVANQDIPQDHVFISGLYQIAKKNKIRSIISGSNYATESILPTAWGYDASDRDHIKDICIKHGAGRAYRRIPTTRLYDLLVTYPMINKIKTYSLLNNINYSKERAIKELSEIGWVYYGGKHYESRWTHFFQSYYLPKRFGYDKRLAHLSSLILSKEITREEALLEIKKKLYDINEVKKDITFISKKLGIKEKEFVDLIEKCPKRDYKEYKNTEKLRNNFYRNFYRSFKNIIGIFFK